MLIVNLTKNLTLHIKNRHKFPSRSCGYSAFYEDDHLFLLNGEDGLNNYYYDISSTKVRPTKMPGNYLISDSKVNKKIH